MDPTKKKWIDKIVNLFRLGEHKATGGQMGATEAEVMLAVTRARELMVKHNIAMADIEGIKDKATAERVVHDIRSHTAYTRKIRDLADYDLQVAAAVETLFDVKALYGSGRLNAGLSTMRFVGVETDAQIASEVFHIILQHVRKMARRKYGSDSWGKQHTAYAVGFGMRLRTRADELKKAEASNTLALVLYSKTHAIKRWTDDHVNWTKDDRKQKQYDIDGLRHGYHDGGKYNIENFRTSVRGKAEES